MQEIIREYGPTLITVVAIIALLVMITLLLTGSSDSESAGFVQTQFQKLMTTFFNKADVLLPTTGGAGS